MGLRSCPLLTLERFLRNFRMGVVFLCGVCMMGVVEGEARDREARMKINTGSEVYTAEVIAEEGETVKLQTTVGSTSMISDRDSARIHIRSEVANFTDLSDGRCVFVLADGTRLFMDPELVDQMRSAMIDAEIAAEAAL